MWLDSEIKTQARHMLYVIGYHLSIKMEEKVKIYMLVNVIYS